MTRTSPARAPVAAARAPVARETPLGPGWFDSSHELRAGLDVREAEPADLDVPSWVELFLAGGPAQPRAARVASPSAITAIA